MRIRRLMPDDAELLLTLFTAVLPEFPDVLAAREDFDANGR